ncbi:MAG: sigma 54-interacting transcriptional regulator [Candidatus Dadabacteria bacterium]|nr:sigma 54-interacting transcriptional regulator [Candidatus Dadabacteria bacterium]
MRRNLEPGRQTMDEERALRLIVEGTAAETGEGFFKALVGNLAAVLGTRGAWVTEYLPEAGRLSSLAFRLDDGWVDEYEYRISGTPCELVVEKKTIFRVEDNVVDLYPDDPDLGPMGAVSYMGIPLLDPAGNVLGHLAVLDSKPMPEESRVEAIFRIFAARASAELRRLRAETGVREREEKLTRLVDSAMDAIIELDNMLEVSMLNPAAEGVFRTGIPECRRKSFLDFLSGESAARLKGIISELAALPEGRRFLWVAGGLSARRSDGSVFTAEATVSQFEMKKKRYYTVILRNIEERLEAERRIKALSEKADYLNEEINSLRNFGEIAGSSPALSGVINDIARVARTDATVLVTGETGTGKELIARAVHAESLRNDSPLIRVNCAAIPGGLIESEFFGHEKGAFTGATGKREGRFSLADGGTIFLDEIGELQLDLQSKLLRVLQEGEFEPVGSSETRRVDVRVIAATNRDLMRMVKEGKFREDLYYRLSVFPLDIPPLRERGRDVITLAAIFSERFARKIGVTVKPLTGEQIERLAAYGWPGNVRELQNVMERAVITSRAGELNLDSALPAGSIRTTRTAPAPEASGDKRILTHKELLDLERSNIVAALEKSGWRVSGEKGAARLLGVPSTTLGSRIKTLGIRRGG